MGWSSKHDVCVPPIVCHLVTRFVLFPKWVMNAIPTFIQDMSHNNLPFPMPKIVGSNSPGLWGWYISCWWFQPSWNIFQTNSQKNLALQDQKPSKKSDPWTATSGIFRLVFWKEEEWSTWRIITLSICPHSVGYPIILNGWTNQA